MKAVVLVGVLLASMAPRTSHACSCALEVPTISPSDGAIDVPINAVVIVQAFSLPYDYTFALRDANGQDVAFTMEPHFRWVLLRPAALLAPLAHYTVDAMEPQIGQPIAHVQFTTGNMIDATPIAFAGLRSWSAETMQYPIESSPGKYCVSSCVVQGDGHVTSSTVDFDDPPANETALITLTVVRASDRATIDERPIVYGAHYLGFMECLPESPTLDPDEAYCAHVTAYDVAGNMAGADAEICTTPAVCAPMLELHNNCVPSTTCLPQAPHESSGCAATRTGALPIAIVMLALGRRRRRQVSASRCRAAPSRARRSDRRRSRPAAPRPGAR